MTMPAHEALSVAEVGTAQAAKQIWRCGAILGDLRLSCPHFLAARVVTAGEGGSRLIGFVSQESTEFCATQAEYASFRLADSLLGTLVPDGADLESKAGSRMFGYVFIESGRTTQSGGNLRRT
jgi:hypothetical protein